MKITVLSSLPPTKGISAYTVSFLRGIEDKCTTEVLDFKSIYPEFLYPGGTKDSSLKLYSHPNVRIRTFLKWYNPFGWIYAGATARGQIIHAQWWSYVLAPIYITILGIAKLRRKKIVITVHNVKPHEQGIMKALANRSVFSLGDQFILHSKNNKKEFSKTYAIPMDKIHVIPHSILTPGKHLKHLGRKAALERLGIPTSAKVILFFGIIRPYKGLDGLIDAFAEVHKQLPSARLVIAGKSWESWDEYQEKINALGLKKVVKSKTSFIPDDEIDIYFKGADVVVLPYSHFASQSGAGSLSLSFGKAMIVTDVGGLPELVKDPKAVCKPNNPNQLADSLLAVLKDKGLRKKLEEDSRALAKRYSRSRIGNDTVALYEETTRK